MKLLAYSFQGFFLMLSGPLFLAAETANIPIV